MPSARTASSDGTVVSSSANNDSIPDDLKQRFTEEMRWQKRPSEVERRKWMEENSTLRCARCKKSSERCELPPDATKPACTNCTRSKQLCSRTIDERGARAMKALGLNKDQYTQLLNWWYEFRKEKKIPRSQAETKAARKPSASELEPARFWRKGMEVDPLAAVDVDVNKTVSIKSPSLGKSNVAEKSNARVKGKSIKKPRGVITPLKDLTSSSEEGSSSEDRTSNDSESDPEEDKDLNLKSIPKTKPLAPSPRKSDRPVAPAPQSMPAATSSSHSSPALADFLQLNMIKTDIEIIAKSCDSNSMSSKEIKTRLMSIVDRIDDLAQEKMSLAMKDRKEVDSAVESLKRKHRETIGSDRKIKKQKVLDN